MMEDYYDLLGVEPEASAAEIRRAYRERAQTAMWDRPLFATIAEAFETLKDPVRRAEYDRRLGRTPAITESAAEQTRAVAWEPCPVCGIAAPPEEGFCTECGFLLGSPLGSEGEERPLPYLTDAGGRRWALKKGENLVGREGADIALADRAVSRRHARIVVEPERGDVWLEDLGSTNGTQRAGHLLPPGQRALLADGTPLQFGAIQLTLVIPEAPLALPLPPEVEEDERLPVAALDAPAETASEPAAAQEAQPLAKLVGANGQVYALTETTTTFGRRPTNHFVLSGDPYVSGAHVQIVFNGEGFHILDLGSTNGTTLRGGKIPPHTPLPLHDGDEVVLGRTPLTFHTRLEGEAGP